MTLCVSNIVRAGRSALGRTVSSPGLTGQGNDEAVASGQQSPLITGIGTLAVSMPHRRGGDDPSRDFAL